MNVDVGVWPKLTRIVGVLIFLVAAVGVGLWYLPVILHNEALRKENLRLNAQIKQQEELARHLDSSIKALKYDPKTVERVAREKLGYVKPGETMIRFKESATNNLPRR